MGILSKIKDNTDAEENSNRMIISDNPSKNSPEKYASCAEYLGSILYKLGEIGYHGNKLEEYYIQGIEMIDYLESIEESEDRIIKWLDLFLFSNAQNNIEADRFKLDNKIQRIMEDNSLSIKEKERKKQEAYRLFDYKHGLPVDFDEEFCEMNIQLEEAGYNDYDIQQFDQDCLEVIDYSKANNKSDLDILLKIRHLCNLKCYEYE